jgi:hypothetical protein
MENRTEDGSISAFKGFSPDWMCRGMRYELGQSFTHEGDVQACQGGLHACEGNPLDVWTYYPPVCESTRNLNRFASVTASGTISRESGGDSKIAAATLKVEAELKIPDLVACAVKWVMQHIDGTVSEGEERSAATNTGNKSAATNTGFQSAATNTGFQSAATNTGFQSAATNTGNKSAATNTGDYSAATNTGFQSAASVEGAHSVAAATGIGGRAKATAGSAIVLCLRNDEGELQAIRSAIIGEASGLKADTWYSLDDSGEFVEVAA